MSTIANPHHGPRLRNPGLGSALALAASLLVGGCYEGSLARDADEELEDDGQLDVEPLEVACGPTMHVFPVADAHNIGYDSTCTDNDCDISCPDLHANSDWGGDHHGIDVFAYRGAPLVAVTGGTIQKVGVVIRSDGTPSTTSGIRVRLRDDCGWEYYYGHLDQAVVSEGQRVEPGQLLGYMGNTGTSGVHLHFNVSPDGGYSNDIDPFELLKETSPTACGGDVPPPAEPQPEPVPDCDTAKMWAGDALYANEVVTSCNGLYSLVMQDDGNVVLYETGTSTALWSSGTATVQDDPAKGHVVTMQPDGNFVLYDAANTPLWHTGTQEHPGAAMRVEPDGNVVVWDGLTAIWKAR